MVMTKHILCISLLALYVKRLGIQVCPQSLYSVCQRITVLLMPMILLNLYGIQINAQQSPKIPGSNDGDCIGVLLANGPGVNSNGGGKEEEKERTNLFRWSVQRARLVLIEGFQQASCNDDGKRIFLHSSFLSTYLLEAQTFPDIDWRQTSEELGKCADRIRLAVDYALYTLYSTQLSSSKTIAFGFDERKFRNANDAAATRGATTFIDDTVVKFRSAYVKKIIMSNTRIVTQPHNILARQIALLSILVDSFVDAVHDYFFEKATLIQPAARSDRMNNEDERHRLVIGVPWGRNWYSFSVDLTCFLAHYLLLPHALRAHRAKAVDLILAIVKDPRHSLGYKREGANSVYMYGPWMLAHYYDSGDDDKGYKHRNLSRETALGMLENDNSINSDIDCNDIDDGQNLNIEDSVLPQKTTQRMRDNVVKNQAYDYVHSVCELEVVNKRLEKGWHRDATYISHATIVGWGYLACMCGSLSTYAYAFDGALVKTPLNQWRRAASILLHPSIGNGPPGFISRDPRSRATEPKSGYGLAVIPSSKVLRCFNSRIKFVVRGVTPSMGYFEADPANNRFQLWTQFREAYVATTTSPDSISSNVVDELLDFPKIHGLFGHIPSEKNLSSLDFDKLPTRTTTTDIRYPSADGKKFCIVGRYENRLAFMRQSYALPERDYSVEEILLVELEDDEAANGRIRCLTRITNTHPEHLLYVRVKNNKNPNQEGWKMQPDSEVETYLCPPMADVYLATLIDLSTGLLESFVFRREDAQGKTEFEERFNVCETLSMLEGNVFEPLAGKLFVDDSGIMWSSSVVDENGSEENYSNNIDDTGDILRRNGRTYVPYALCAPELALRTSDYDETPNITYNNHTFAFDHVTNQYKFVKNVG